MEVFTFIVAIILVLLPISDWTATYILHKASKRAHEMDKDNVALKERSTIAKVLAVISTINGCFAVFRLIPQTRPDSATITIMLSITLILSGVPNLYWLWLYYSNRLHK